MKNKLKKLGKISIVIFAFGVMVNMSYNNKNQPMAASATNESVDEQPQASSTTKDNASSEQPNEQKKEKLDNKDDKSAQNVKEENIDNEKPKEDVEQKTEKKIERPKNSIRINGEDYPIRVGAQDEVNEMNREFINTGCYFARRDGTGGVEYKTNGDGMSIYLAIESEGYGHVIWNTKKFDFTDINGNTESYHFIGTGCYMHYDYGIFEEQEYKETIYAGYAGDLIAIQTCDWDSYGTGKARTYYFVRD